MSTCNHCGHPDPRVFHSCVDYLEEKVANRQRQTEALQEENKQLKVKKAKTIEITAVWLRRMGTDAQVLVEIDGEWKLAAHDYFGSNFSHIAEALGSKHWPVDTDLD